LAILAVAAASAVYRSLPLIWPSLGKEPARIAVADSLKPADHVQLPPAHGANLCLITLDTTRADRLGCYGNKDIATPHLDKLANTGVLFTHAYSPTPVTLPAHSSIMTGLYPYHHGARVNALNRLNEKQETLAEILAGAGYETAAFVSAHVLDPQYGIAQGFATYDIEVATTSEHWSAVAERSADKTIDQAIGWLRGQPHGDAPFFLWVHLFDPHWEYKPPAPFAEQYAHYQYDGEIAFMDEQIGRLLAALGEIGAADRTLVVTVGDHGESLGQHAEATHGTFVYDATLHVPMIFNYRGDAGVRVDRPASLIDVLPTTLALLGVAVPHAVDGVNLTQPAKGTRTLFFETLEGMAEYGWTPFFGAQRATRKYIYGPMPEMYDLKEDYLERKNLLQRDPHAGDELAAAVSAFYGGDLAAAGNLETDTAPSAADIAKLKALGYVFGGNGGEVAPEDRLNPHEYLPLLREVNQAFDMSREDWLAHGTTIVEKVVREHPDFYVARKELGSAYLAQGRLEEAEEQYRACLELRPDLVTVQCYLALVRAQQGYVDDAIKLYQVILGEMPDDMLSTARLGGLLLRAGRTEEAVPVLRRAHEMMAQDVDVAINLAVALAKSDQRDEAFAVLRKMLQRVPDSAQLRNRLTRMLRSAGRYEEAVQILREGCARQPERLDLAANLGINLAEWTDPTGARQREAVSILERVNEQTQRSNAGYLHALGRAYAATGRLDAAIAASQKAQNLAANAGETTLAGVIDRDLAMFTDARQKMSVNVGTNGMALPPARDVDMSTSGS